MKPQVSLSNNRTLLLLLAAGTLMLGACHSSTPVGDCSMTSSQVSSTDTSKTPGDSARVSAQMVPQGGGTCQS